MHEEDVIWIRIVVVCQLRRPVVLELMITETDERHQRLLERTGINLLNALESLKIKRHFAVNTLSEIFY